MARTKNTAKSDMSQISISLSKELIKQIDLMAEADNRNRSNFIANTLLKIAMDFEKSNKKQK